MGGWRDRQIDRWTDGEAGKLIDGWIDRQPTIYRERERNV